jgi:hypothetical protein
MHMTAIRASPIAVPSLACMSRTCLERGVAALAETRLALHGAELTTTRSGANNRSTACGAGSAPSRGKQSVGMCSGPEGSGDSKAIADELIEANPGVRRPRSGPDSAPSRDKRLVSSTFGLCNPTRVQLAVRHGTAGAVLQRSTIDWHHLETRGWDPLSLSPRPQVPPAPAPQCCSSAVSTRREGAKRTRVARRCSEIALASIRTPLPSAGPRSMLWPQRLQRRVGGS